MRPALAGIGPGRRRATHAVCVWTRDWPQQTAHAWSCVCGARYTRDLPTIEAARDEAAAHMTAHRTTT